MIAPRSGPLADFEKALSTIDFEPDNAEIRRLKGEIAAVRAKAQEVEAEARRLADEIRDWRGPEPDAVAAALMAGRSLTDASGASSTREELVARRDALFASLSPLGAMADDLQRQVVEIEARQRGQVVEAARAYITHLATVQRQAAEAITAADAGIQALERTLQCYLPEEQPSRRAREGVTGGDSLLGWRDNLPVPEDLVRALRPLVDRCEAIGWIPDTIATR